MASTLHSSYGNLNVPILLLIQVHVASFLDLDLSITNGIV